MKKYQYEELADQILSNADRYEWSLQGFGMLRFYVTQEIRIHVWDSRYRVDNVSGIHTHPWHFDSTVLCGRIKQHRYTRIDTPRILFNESFPLYDEYVIRAGEGGHLEGESTVVALKSGPLEVVKAGEFYSQSSEEIHYSFPEDGTVTVVQRRLANPDRPDHAYVYVPAGQEWVSAEPRPATPEEVENITSFALSRWSRERS